MTQQELINAVQEFFSDKSRSPQETREGLEAAAAEIEILIDSLPQ